MKKYHFIKCITFLLVTSIFLSCKKDNETNTQTNFNGKVIIVGAGAAGLAAANEFEKQGIDYQILEASNRYGGRIQKNDTFADFPIDLGAEWIHDDKTLLNTLIGGTDPNVETILYQPLNVYSLSGTDYDQISISDLEAYYSDFVEYKFKNTTWYDFINENFAQDVKHNIVYDSKVTTIDYSGNQVKLTTQKGNEYIADKVIVTVSIGVLKSNAIEFMPALSAQKTQAIESVEFLPGFKLFLKFSDKFYPDDIFCEVPNGEKTYYDVAYHKDAQDNVFGLLSTGISAENYYQLGSEQAIVNAILTELDGIYNGAASANYTGDYLLKDWSQQVFTLETWTDNDDENSELSELNTSLDNKVYFAGETYDTNEARSTVQGAIFSGKETVNRILN